MKDDLVKSAPSIQQLVAPIVFLFLGIYIIYCGGNILYLNIRFFRDALRKTGTITSVTSRTAGGGRRGIEEWAIGYIYKDLENKTYYKQQIVPVFIEKRPTLDQKAEIEYLSDEHSVSRIETKASKIYFWFLSILWIFLPGIFVYLIASYLIRVITEKPNA